MFELQADGFFARYLLLKNLLVEEKCELSHHRVSVNKEENVFSKCSLKKCKCFCYLHVNNAI